MEKSDDNLTWIAEAAGLEENHLTVYVKFMQQAFRSECVSRTYAEEWGERFRQGKEWECADKRRKAVLRELYGVF